MKNTLYSTLITLIIALTLTFTTNTPAQDSPQWHLPDGATARYGKGTIHQITYSPDSTKMAVATSIGIWIYDTETGDELNLLSGHTEAVDSVAFHPDGEYARKWQPRRYRSLVGCGKWHGDADDHGT